MNDGKYLRATYGTTKYCSSYLRGQQCQNSNCMFLHEPGEEADSYTRQDLSTIQHEKTTTQTKHDTGNDISLPASVSWATKSVGTTSPPAPPLSQTTVNSFPVPAYPNNHPQANGSNITNNSTPQLPKNMPYKTTSPPGLKNSQELLAHLMKRGA
ncbi:hypothetical protein D0Z03_002631 [Geotrichum reessii]|nr:hypothetical protein D0Z03_002631 [Galactomyces reessii]